MSLRWKLTALLAVVVVISSASIGAISFWTLESRLMTEIDRSLIQATDRFLSRSNAAVRFGPRGRVIVTVPDRPLGIEQFVVQVTDDQGTILAASTDVELPTVELERWSGSDQAVVETVDSLQGQQYRVRSVIVEIGPSVRAVVQLGRDLSETANVLRDLQRRILVVGAVFALAGAIAGWLIATGLTSRLRRLSTVSEEIADTASLDIEVPMTGSDEVGRLARSFRGMLQALSLSKRQQQQLVQDAGHELRTPLTSLKMNLDVLRRHSDLSEALRGQVLDDLNRDADELAQLVEEVLSLASDSTTSLHGHPVEVIDLRALVVDRVHRAQRRTGRTIHVLGPTDDERRSGPLMVLGQRPLIERAISNLVDNALKFDSSEAPIDVVIDGGTVTVLDRGPGIPVEELEHVFERFHRAVEARSLPGSGLGLAIVADAARLHHGEYFARNRPDGGAEVGISLPLIEQMS